MSRGPAAAGEQLRAAGRTLSATACLVILVCWARGYWRNDLVSLTRDIGHPVSDDVCIYVESGGGRLSLRYYASHFTATKPDWPSRRDWRWQTGTLSTLRWMKAAERWLPHRDPDDGFTRDLRGVGLIRLNRYATTETMASGVQCPARVVECDLAMTNGLLTVATGTWPTWWLVSAWRRARRHRTGACIRCGYDLRGSPGRCPECGAVPA